MIYFVSTIYIYIYIYIHISCCINSKFIHIKLKDAWFIAKEYQRGVHILSNEWRRDWFVIILNDINYPSCASYFEWRYSLYVMRLKLKRNVLILNKCHDIPRAGFNSNIYRFLMEGLYILYHTRYVWGQISAYSHDIKG